MMAKSNCPIALMLALVLVAPAARNCVGAEITRPSNRFEPTANQSRSDESIVHFIARSQLAPVTPALAEVADAVAVAAALRTSLMSMPRIELSRPRLVNFQPTSPSSDATPSAASPAIDAISKIANPDSIQLPANFLYVRFSKPFLESRICELYDRTLPVYDTILGACVRGTSRTIAHTELNLIENRAQAQWRVQFKGATWFNAIGYSGPVQVYSRGITGFVSQKWLSFDGLDIHQSAPMTAAETSNTTTGITTCLPRLRGRIALRIATRREAENHHLAECIGAEHNGKKIERAFDADVKARTDAFSGLLRNEYAKLPFDSRFAITDIRCNTTPGLLQIIVLGRGSQDPNYVPAPPLLENYPDVEVDVHTALVQKALLDPALRSTLEAAVRRLVQAPIIAVDSATGARRAEPPKELKIQWTEGQGSQWLSLGWYATDKS